MERLTILNIFLLICRPISIFINHVNWRFGRAFDCTNKEIAKIKDHITPGMVILTHKKYEFSTFFIPGYWTHSALVVTKDSIVEATGKGVCMNTMESFFSGIDDFIILNPRFCSQDTMEKASRQAATLVGYPYSYDFRNSNKTFYCSALICWAYAQTLIEKGSRLKIPYVFKNFLNGMIIKPIDIYSDQDAWQVYIKLSSNKENLQDSYLSFNNQPALII